MLTVVICLQISKDEKFIFCSCGSRVNVLEISTGKVVHSVEHVSIPYSILQYIYLDKVDFFANNWFECLRLYYL